MYHSNAPQSYPSVFMRFFSRLRPMSDPDCRPSTDWPVSRSPTPSQQCFLRAPLDLAPIRPRGALGRVPSCWWETHDYISCMQEIGGQAACFPVFFLFLFRLLVSSYFSVYQAHKWREIWYSAGAEKAYNGPEFFDECQNIQYP